MNSVRVAGRRISPRAYAPYSVETKPCHDLDAYSERFAGNDAFEPFLRFGYILFFVFRE